MINGFTIAFGPSAVEHTHRAHYIRMPGTSSRSHACLLLSRRIWKITDHFLRLETRVSLYLSLCTTQIKLPIVLPVGRHLQCMQPPRTASPHFQVLTILRTSNNFCPPRIPYTTHCKASIWLYEIGLSGSDFCAHWPATIFV